MSRILVVEDDKTILSGLVFTLEDENYQVDSVSTVELAKIKLSETKYDLLLLDVMLPDGTGYDICKFVRNTSEVPIIFLTACDEEVSVVMGLELGGDDYITKPFKIKELMARIRANIRRVAGKKENHKVLKIGNLEINTDEASVKKNGNEVFLTAVEYKLLLLFMKNSNVVLSRKQILEKLWDVSGEFINDNTLTVYTKRLREKIEDTPSEPQYIQTVRGLGYKWNSRGI